MEIKAMAALERGAELTPWSYEVGPLGAFDILVEVDACGLCHSDLHMIDDDWGGSRYPLVAGHEVVGRIVERGEQVTHLSVGDRVGVGWQRSACLQCDDCLRGDENLCSATRSLIGDGYGGFADHVVVDGRFAFALPAGIETRIAGPLLCGGATVYTALRHAGMTSGQHIGIIGVGGLGHLAVQFAAELGNRVTVFTSSDDKAQLAGELGAHDAVLVSGDGKPPKLRDKLDIVLSTVPVNLDFASYLELLGTRGTLCFVGGSTETVSFQPFGLMLKQKRVTGSVIGSRSTINEMLRIADAYGVAPLVEGFPLYDVNTAIDKLRSNAIRYRAVLAMS